MALTCLVSSCSNRYYFYDIKSNTITKSRKISEDVKISIKKVRHLGFYKYYEISRELTLPDDTSTYRIISRNIILSDTLNGYKMKITFTGSPIDTSGTALAKRLGIENFKIDTGRIGYNININNKEYYYATMLHSYLNKKLIMEFKKRTHARD